MESEVPDVLGYSYEEATDILQKAGYKIQTHFTGLSFQRPFSEKTRILRQRLVEEKNVELTIGYEFYPNPI
ncbi:MAG: PASTA domain-containing protein [Bacillota bacterium]|nr:PASTA domain-containing protein [Bacillota bacterium]